MHIAAYKKKKKKEFKNILTNVHNIFLINTSFSATSGIIKNLAKTKALNFEIITR